MTSPAARRTFMKDLQQLYRTIDASTDGQASIVGIDEMTVKVALRPKAGHNAHAEFQVTIECCATYPMTCPKVTFNSPIFHPNIDPSNGWVCLSILDDWQSCYGLLDLIKAFLYLINHPNFDTPYGPFGIPEDSAKLATNSVRILAGLPVNGLRFPPNPTWVEWARVNDCMPSEEEGELGEEEVEACVNEHFDQNIDKEIIQPANTAASDDEKSNVETLHALSDTASDSVPSFAKIRYLLDANGEENSWCYYEDRWPLFEVRSQRILIWPPSDDNNSNTFAVFFFVEFLGTLHHRFNLGQNYGTLFIGSVLHEFQSQPESRQTSSDCPWFAFLLYPEFSYRSYGRCSSSLNLSTIFEGKEMPMHDLTEDFCPWSKIEGKDTYVLFGGLFFEGSRNRGVFTCFLDEDGDGDDSISRLFDICSSNHEKVVIEPDELSEAKSHDKPSNFVEESPSESEDSPTEEQESDINETYDEKEKAPSTTSSTTYREDLEPRSSITECVKCWFDYWNLSGPIDANLTPVWKWILRLTRWPFRFAPQQNVELSMTGIRVLPWRASSGRMMSDVCQFCAKNQDISNLVLLDPMVSHLVTGIPYNALYASDFVTSKNCVFDNADSFFGYAYAQALSPLSPLLNLMRHHALPTPRLTGVLWMTPLDALSPFYRVPVPITAQQKNSDDKVHEGDDDVYPTPTCLRFLAITAYLTNWVAWLSRMESYSVLGMSRFSPLLISAPVAAHTLQPFSLGCGQAPLLDLWPLWLLRRLLTLSLRLSQFHIPFLQCNRQHLQYLFPFSDIDEI